MTDARSRAVDQVDQRRELMQQMLRARGLSASADPIDPRPEAAPAPLTPAQRRMWFLAQLRPDSAAYNVCVSIRIAGALDVAAFGTAVARRNMRHEALLTAFQLGADGEPVRVRTGASAGMPRRWRTAVRAPGSGRKRSVSTPQYTTLRRPAGKPISRRFS